MSDAARETNHEEPLTLAGEGLDLQLKRVEINIKKADLEIKQVELELRKIDINLKKAEMFEREVNSLEKAHDLLDMLEGYEGDGEKLIKRKVLDFIERCNKFAKKMTAVDD